MSKTISGGLLSHIQGEVTTRARLCRIARLDGEVFAFTDHDQDITYSGVTYLALNSFDSSAVDNAAGLSVANLDFSAIIDSESLTESELRTGLFDFATFELREVNYKDLTLGHYSVRFGILGEVSVAGPFYQGELRGLAQLMQQKVGRNHTRRCIYDLGDSNCTVDLAPLTNTGTVATVTNRQSITVSGLSDADDYYNHGLLTWTSGLNVKFPMEVKRWVLSSGAVELFLPEPFNIVVGDTFEVYPGCDKNRPTCVTKFNNVVNFGGFPDMPGRDQIVSYPDSPY